MVYREAHAALVQASHINQVVGDTKSWEAIAAFKLEQAAKQGLVRFYARNDSMGLVIPYQFHGVDHSYEPDFLVRLNVHDGDFTLVLEIKGYEDEQDRQKHTDARRWTSAVNNWGKLGRWAFHVCRNPQHLDQEIALITQHAKKAA